MINTANIVWFRADYDCKEKIKKIGYPTGFTYFTLVIYTESTK